MRARRPIGQRSDTGSPAARAGSAAAMGRLDGRRALVTGASSGIGALAAELLAGEGADVALLARGDGLTEVARRVEAAGGGRNRAGAVSAR